MASNTDKILPINIEDELKRSYLDYAMSVIVGRALPDVRDGLKPVHRRVLFAMKELGNDWNKAYKKSARIVGDVIGKYHPHGDSAVYETIVRMAQSFSMRYPLVDGQGNFGSIDGDSAAAMRYTEIRMAKIAHDLLIDLDKETVDFVPNYDGSEQIPEILPTRIPNLLVNGASGIAVGMATNVPPHNLREVIHATLHLIDNPEASIDELIEHISGPDFPTGGIINGRAGILQAYKTGRGRIYVRAKATVEDESKGNRQTIIIHELPYQVNKARLIEKIVELVKDKKIEGISEIRDESDKDGMRVVIELKKGEVGDVVLNNLYAQTQLENVFGINIVALVERRPQILNLKALLSAFVQHRQEVVTRRTVFELKKAKERGHLLEGLAVALSNIDPFIDLIKKSESPKLAKEKIMATDWPSGYVQKLISQSGGVSCQPEMLEPIYGIHGNIYKFTDQQAQAILDMRLHRLTGLEHEKLLTEYKEILERIKELLLILSDFEHLMGVIREELKTILENYGDARRTEIISSRQDLTIEDLITEEDVVVTLSHSGYAKSTSLDEYRAQRRGGRGKAATKVKEEDYVIHMLVVSNHTQLLLFSTKGKVYWLKAYQIPLASRTSRGRPLINLLPLDEGEHISAMLPVSEYFPDMYLIFATAKGTVKKTALAAYSRPLSSGIRAINLAENDELIGVSLCTEGSEIMLFSDAGKVVRFSSEQVRAMGRVATGVRGIKLQDDQRVVSLIVPDGECDILTATANGYGKRTELSEYPLKNRATQGVLSIKVTKRNGVVIGANQVLPQEDIMLITNQGTLVRTSADGVSRIGRNTQGVRLIRLSDEEQLVGLEKVAELQQIDNASEDEVVTDESEEQKEKLQV